MRRYPDADRAAAAYFTALEALTSIPAQRISETVSVCRSCGGPESIRPIGGAITLGLSRHAEDRWYSVCADCGRPWSPDEFEVGLLRGAVKLKGDRVVRASYPSRPGGTEERMLDSLETVYTLRHVIEPRPRTLTDDRWSWTLRLWRLYLHPSLSTYAGAARWVQEATGASDPSADQAQRAIGLARGVVEMRMRRSEHRRAAV